MVLTLRSGRNRPLSHAEVDANFKLIVNDGRAIGDGIADDTVALQSVLSAGEAVILDRTKTYLLTSRLTISVAGTGIEGNGALIKMSTAAGHFDNATYAGRYGSDAVCIRADDLDGVYVRNCRITLSAWVDLLYLKAIYFENCTRVDVSGNEIYGLSRGKGAVTLNDCGVQTGNLNIPAGRIVGNIIRDCYTNSSTGTSQEKQITAIDVDSDCLTGTYGLLIDGNILMNMTCSYNAISGIESNHQTDAIQLAGLGTTKPTRGCRIVNNYIYNVGEGVDCFGDENIIANNTFERCFSYAVKILNGASRNIVNNNTIMATGNTAIIIAGGTGVTTVDCDKNVISGNIIKDVCPTGDWYNADGGLMWDATDAGAAAWAAATTTGVTLNFQNNSATSDITNTIVSDNIITTSSTAAAGIRISGNTGNSKTNVIRDNKITGFTTDYSDVSYYMLLESSRAMVLIRTLTPTSGTTIDLTDIPSHVRKLVIEVDTIIFSGASALTLAVSADNGSNFGTAVTVSNATPTGSSAVVGEISVANISVAGRTCVVNPATYANATAFTTLGFVTGSGSANGPYNAVRFASSTAETFSSGTIRIYGLAA